MRIELTVDQAAQLHSDVWDDDDELRESPASTWIGQLGQIVDNDDNLIGYAIAHPSLTFEDEIVLHHALNDRAARVAAVEALPKARKAKGYRDLKAEILEVPRCASNKALKDGGQFDRDARRHAKSEMRAALREIPAIAAAIAAKRAELDNLTE